VKRQKALGVLVGVRVRRTRMLEQAFVEAVKAHQTAIDAETAAEEAAAGARAAEDAQRQKLRTMTDCGECFDIGALLARQHLVQTLSVVVAQRQAELGQRKTEMIEQQAKVSARRADVARNHRKIEVLHEQIAVLAAARRQAEDDEQDEEAEEVAISRMIRESRSRASSGAHA